MTAPKIAASVIDAIGNTPLIRLRHASEATGCEILAKAEFMIPGNRSRIAPHCSSVRDAERRGWLKPGGRIVEGTAGNTGIGLAMVASALGYRTTIVIPRTQSEEKKDAIRLAGRNSSRWTPSLLNPDNYVRYSGRLAEMLGASEPAGAVWANQFDNTANRQAHAETTGRRSGVRPAARSTGSSGAVGLGGTLAEWPRRFGSAAGGPVSVLPILMAPRSMSGTRMANWLRRARPSARYRPGPDNGESGGPDSRSALQDFRRRNDARDL